MLRGFGQYDPTRPRSSVAYSCSERFRSGGPSREAASTRAFSAQSISWVDQLAPLEGQAAAPDIGRQVVAEPLELFDPDIELLPPGPGQLRTIGLAGSPPSWKPVEGFSDVGERDADRLRRPDERQSAEGVTAEPALVPLVAGGEDESFPFVEVECGDRQPTALRDLADRPRAEQFLTSDHGPRVVLDLNIG